MGSYPLNARPQQSTLPDAVRPHVVKCPPDTCTNCPWYVAGTADWPSLLKYQHAMWPEVSSPHEWYTPVEMDLAQYGL
jgi:hypothetical protein